MRCERSPTPVRVGVNTLCPPFCRRSATRRQHQPPCQAPCTRTKVFGAPVCADAGALPKAAALAPAPALASTPRRVMAASLVELIMSSLRLVVGAIFSEAGRPLFSDWGSLSHLWIAGKVDRTNQELRVFWPPAHRFGLQGSRLA